MNAQRSEIYSFRSEAMQVDDPRETLFYAIEQAVRRRLRKVSSRPS